ncbi:MAG: ABC transporter ATP-binding protein [Bauldia litoralis]
MAPFDISHAPESGLALDIRGLTKVYRGGRHSPEKTALNGVDLAVPQGSLFGLLGPNGAGKSTLINILGGMVNKTRGDAEIWGIDITRHPRQSRSAIGIVPQELNIDAFFTPREMLDVQAGLYGVPKSERRTEELLAAMGLSDKAEAYSRTLSGGMRRRLMVAKAMVHDPPVLVLDEPTAGVVVEVRLQLWDQVREVNRRGTSILLTSDYLEEAEELCDRIAIINHGEVIACDTTRALLKQLDRKELSIVLTEDLAELPAALVAHEAELHPPRRIVVSYRPSQTRIRDILDAVRDSGLSIADLSTQESDLEDLFLELTRSPAPGDTPREGKAA